MGIIINPRQIIKDGITSLRDVWSSSKVSTELSGKQATLVSGVNIKTINTQSLLGSGDIHISGGGDIPRIDMTATTATLDPNKFYVWGEVASLDISLAAETAGIENIYKFQFESGGVATALSLPQDIYFDGDFPNDIKTKYIVTIISRIAKIDRLQKQSLLPVAYQQVEYLESTGLQYINTGINGNSEYTMEVELQGNVNQPWVFGCRVAYNDKAFHFANGGMDGVTWQNGFCNYGANHTVMSVSSVNDGAKHLYAINKNVFTIDGNIVATLNEATFVNTIPIALFASNMNNIIGYGKYKIFRSTIKEGTTLLQDLYPCYRKSDNAAGMYDIVRDVFLTNAGSGSFIVGPDV